MKFTKMHGLGNDYVYVNCFEEQLANVDLPELAKRISNRNFGVGGDGLILIMPSESADFRMRMFNSDGSEGKTCGNGLRCVSKFVYDHGLTKKPSFTIETLGGIVSPRVEVGPDGKVSNVTIDMGEPRFLREEIPMAGPVGEKSIEQPIVVDGRQYLMTNVSMGNPHAIFFVDEITDEDVLVTGPKIESHSLFPERTNVEFIKVLNPRELQFRVYERGSGETLACGTGACAAAVAAIVTGRAEREVTVHLLGGDLRIEWREDDNRVYMTGPATEVFQGVYQAELPLV